jgi:hypothetical protein
MLIVDRALMGGLGFVLRRIAEVADARLNDEGALKEELIAAHTRLELGEITEDELEEIERDILGHLRDIRARREGESARSDGKLSVASIEADVGEDGGGVPHEPPRKRAPRRSKRKR